MSTVMSSAGRAWNSSHVQRAAFAPVSSTIVKSHSSSDVNCVGPAVSTGKSSTTYWPGGMSPAPAWRRRPLNPRLTIAMAGNLEVAARLCSGGEVGLVRAHRVAAALGFLPVLLAAEGGEVEEVVRPACALQAARVLRVRVEHAVVDL